MNWINDCEILWKIIKIFELYRIWVIFDHFWLFRAGFWAYTMLGAIFFFLFLLSYTSLYLHSCIFEGLKGKILSFFINFAYSEKLVILGCFGPFWVSSKSLIAATNCFLARPNSKHHTGVNWINDRDFLWKINQIFEF